MPEPRRDTAQRRSARQCLRRLLVFSHRFCVAGHQALEPLQVSFKAVKLRSGRRRFGLFFFVELCEQSEICGTHLFNFERPSYRYPARNTVIDREKKCCSSVAEDFGRYKKALLKVFAPGAAGGLRSGEAPSASEDLTTIVKR